MVEANEEQLRVVREMLDSYSRYIGHRTVTFNWMDESEAPWQNGTGVLLRIGDRSFILTAAHVADEIKAKHDAGRPTFIVGGGMVARAPIPLDRIVVLSSPLGEKKRHWDELFDVATIELSPFVVEKLVGHNSFLGLDQLDLAVDQREPGCFYIFGFPAKSNEHDHDQLLLTSTPFPICTALSQADLTGLLFFDSSIGLVFDFDPQAGGKDGVRVAPPLGGISGCGIWRMGPAAVPMQEWDPTGAKLVAIEHKEVTSQKAIVGTRVKFALQMLHSEYQDLHGAIAAVFPSLE